MSDIAITGRAAKQLRLRLNEDLSDGLTLEYLANKIGVTQGMLSLYENEKRNLSPEAMQELRKALNEAVVRAIGERQEKIRREEARRELEAKERKLISMQFPVTGDPLSGNIARWSVVGQGKPSKKLAHAG